MKVSVNQRLLINLNKLTNQLRQSRDEDDCSEINLRRFEEELKPLTNELTNPSNISIREDSTSFISKRTGTHKTANRSTDFFDGSF